MKSLFKLNIFRLNWHMYLVVWFCRNVQDNNLDTSQPGLVPADHDPPSSAVQVMETRKPNYPINEELEDRDPNNLNPNLQIIWDEVIGEPEGVRAPERAWRVSRWCLLNSHKCCYTFLSVILAPPTALLCGCGLACLAFQQIWCCNPCFRCIRICCPPFRTLVQSLLAVTLVPIMDALGYMCRHIHVNLRRDAPDEKDLLTV